MGCKMAKNKKRQSSEKPLELTKQEILLLNRKELQSYCKKYGIKANGKTSDLQEQLIKLSLTKDTKNISDTEQKNEAVVADDKMSFHDDIKTDTKGKSKYKAKKRITKPKNLEKPENERKSRKRHQETLSSNEEDVNNNVVSLTEQTRTVTKEVDDKSIEPNEEPTSKAMRTRPQEGVNKQDHRRQNEGQYSKPVNSLIHTKKHRGVSETSENNLESSEECEFDENTSKREKEMVSFVNQEDKNTASNEVPEQSEEILQENYKTQTDQEEQAPSSSCEVNERNFSSSFNFDNNPDQMCHTTSCLQDDTTDSISNEIMSIEALNATFNLDKTYVKSSNDVIPHSRRRSTTFVVERQSMGIEDMSGCDSTSPGQGLYFFVNFAVIYNIKILSCLDVKSNSMPHQTTSQTTRWCVVEGQPKTDRQSAWRLIKLKGGQPKVPNTFGKYIRFVLEPSPLDVPTEYQDNFICGLCAKRNEKIFGEAFSRNSAGPSLEKENSTTPLNTFERAPIRGSVKRKRVDKNQDKERDLKRQKQSSSSLLNKSPASPLIRKARGEVIHLPRNHKIPWLPKVPSRSTTPVNITEDASYAEKVEAIIQNTVPGSEEELKLIMTKRCRVQRSPTKT